MSFGGRRGEAANILFKDYALNYIISERHRRNHLENRVYIHDLDSYAVGMHNCLTLPIDDMAKNGAREQEKRMAANNTQASKSAVDVVKNLLKETVQIASARARLAMSILR